MRLNRVLLLAAIVNMMIFALVFTISCSGEDGASGAPGTGCTVVENSSGNWDIMCEGEEDRVGELRGKGGLPGASGNPGNPGSKGGDGQNCWLEKTSKGFQVFCQDSEDPKGDLSGCSIAALSKYESVISCAASEVHICGQIPFNPTEYECDATDGTIAENSTIVYGFCGPDKKPYDQAKQYCGFSKTDRDVPTEVYKICDGSKIHETEFQDQAYCRYTSETEMSVVGDSPADYCNGQRLNEDGWLRQYCGWASNEALIKTRLVGACDSASSDGIIGPNEVVFGQGYCEVTFESKSTGKTVYSENLCGTSANNKPNNLTWKGQYCGWDSTNTAQNTVYTGICDDSAPGDIKAPHLEKYNAGYCAVVYDETKTMVKGKGKMKTEFVEDFCGANGKPNEWGWEGQYCGFESADSKKADHVYDNICDDGQGPNQSSWNIKEYCTVIPDGDPYKSKTRTELTAEVCKDGKKFNEGGWKAQYCGYNKGSKETSLQEDACDDGLGPHSESYNGGYCTVPYRAGIKIGTGVTVYTNDLFCGDLTPAIQQLTKIPDSMKINEGSWKGQYCGFKNSKHEEEGIETSQNGACDDGVGPLQYSFDNKGYCKYDRLTGSTAYSTDWCTKTTIKNNEPSYSRVSVNETTWKGEFCTADSLVRTCRGGLEPVPGAKSTDANLCGLPSMLAYCQNSFLGKNVADSAFNYGTNGKCVIYTSNDRSTGCVATKIVAADSSRRFSKGSDIKAYSDCKYKLDTIQVDTSITHNPADTLPDGNWKPRLALTKAMCTANLKGKEVKDSFKDGNTPFECVVENVESSKCESTTKVSAFGLDTSKVKFATANGVTKEAPYKCEFTPSVYGL